MKKHFLSILLLLISCFSLSVYADEDLNLNYILDEDSNIKIIIQNIDGENYLFLPSSSNLENMNLDFDCDSLSVSNLENKASVELKNGEAFNLMSLIDGMAEPCKLKFEFNINNKVIGEKNIIIMQSANINSLFLKSKDMAKGRTFVDAKKSNRAKGEIFYINNKGDLIYDGDLKEIKSRGNTTWFYPKKPYQIKLKEKFDLLETGIEDEANKTWILLANYQDDSLIRNSISFDIARYMDIPYTPNFKHVDLYYDGEYRGSYLLIEKTQVKEGRVDVYDLEEDFEKSNPDKNLKKQDTEICEGDFNTEIKYVKDINSPEDYTGGYLLEIDVPSRADEEMSYFKTKNSEYVVSKFPEYLSREAIEYISKLYQNFEDAVFNGGKHPETDKKYTDFADLETLAKSYLHLEFIMNDDGFVSSTFFNKRKGEEKLYAGPIWDCDGAFYPSQKNLNVDTLIVARKRLPSKLIDIPSFREAVKKYYYDELDNIIAENVLNDANNNGKSIEDYRKMLRYSYAMDRVLWKTEDFDGTIDKLKDRIEKRNDYLREEFKSWDKKVTIDRRYIDVKKEEWFYEAIEYLSEKGLFYGIGSYLFLPKEKVNDYHASLVLHRLSDTEDYREFMDYLYEEKVFTRENIENRKLSTRADLVYAIYIMTHEESTKLDDSDLQELEAFIDAGDMSMEHKLAFSWAIKEGVIYGKGSGKLEPKSTITRAEFAAIIKRAISEE